jgi:hypothetical protein
MSDSKFDQMMQGAQVSRPALSEENREHLGKSLLSPKKVQATKVLCTIEDPDLQWIDEAVQALKDTRRRTTRSEMMKVGIALMKEKSPEELGELLRKYN